MAITHSSPEYNPGHTSSRSKYKMYDLEVYELIYIKAYEISGSISRMALKNTDRMMVSWFSQNEGGIYIKDKIKDPEIQWYDDPITRVANVFITGYMLPEEKAQYLFTYGE